MLAVVGESLLCHYSHTALKGVQACTEPGDSIGRDVQGLGSSHPAMHPGMRNEPGDLSRCLVPGGTGGGEGRSPG